MKIDIHCHASSKPYLTDDPKAKNLIQKVIRFKSLVSPVLKFLENSGLLKTGLKFSSQANFDTLYNGGVRVAFVSITPLEKAFIVGGDKAIFDFLIKKLPLGKNKKRDFIKAITGFGTHHLKFIDDTLQDYYTESFLPEYQYLCNAEKLSPANYSIRFPRNKAELDNNLQDDSILNIIITIEGAHSFGAAPTSNQLSNLNEAYPLTQAKEDQMLQNIDAIKKFDIPVFSVGVFHHFWNGLGGQCDSIGMSGLFNQDAGTVPMQGLTATGKKVIQRLTDNKNGRSVIIDIKHMSPLSRIDFYKMRDKGQPVICSHTGYAIRFPSLKEWATRESELETGTYYLHEHSINICREDAVEIYGQQTQGGYIPKGLIGIQLDKKRLFSNAIMNLIENNKPEATRRRIYAKYILGNMYAVISDLSKHHQYYSKDFWNIITIGSDFDGVINYLDYCSDATQLDNLYNDLKDFLDHPEDILIRLTSSKLTDIVYTVPVQRLMNDNQSSAEILDKIFYKNAKRFLLHHF